MQYRNLGSLTHISALGLGCAGMSDFYGKADPVEAKQVIQKAFDLGINFFDTADIYGHGANEILVGETIKSFRNQIYIASKCGIVRDEANPTVYGINNKPAYIKSSCDASLKRLQIDHIDLYYLHRIDPQVPIEESVGALSNIITAGKIRYIGLSEATAETIRRAHKIHPITAVQSEYSLWSRNAEIKVLPTCRELGIGFVPSSPIGRGFLTGKIQTTMLFDDKDVRHHFPRFQKENFAANLAIVKKIQIIADNLRCTAAQLVLAWLLAQGDDIIPIPGTKRLQYVVENIQALQVNLSKAEIDQLNTIAAEIKGARYTQQSMDMFNIQD